MKPLRMCMVCRKRLDKNELIRIAKNSDGEIVIDIDGKAPGRGAYLCKKVDCVSASQKRKALERAFSRKVEPELYEKLGKIAEVLKNES